MSAPKTYEATQLDRIEAARLELQSAEAIKRESASRLAAAERAWRAATPATSDKQLKVIREEREMASERVALAERDVDAARSRLVTLQFDLKFAVSADDERRIAESLDAMRVHVRKARSLRVEADRIDAEDIGPIWASYIELAGLTGQNVDHRLEATPERPRDLIDLYDATAALDGENVPSQYERTPVGAFLSAHAERQNRNAAADQLVVKARAAREITKEENAEHEARTARRRDWKAEAPPRPPTLSPLFEYEPIEGASK